MFADYCHQRGKGVPPYFRAQQQQQSSQSSSQEMEIESDERSNSAPPEEEVKSGEVAEDPPDRYQAMEMAEQYRTSKFIQEKHVLRRRLHTIKRRLKKNCYESEDKIAKMEQVKDKVS